MLREQGKTQVQIAQITGYTRSHAPTMLKRLGRARQMLGGKSRGERPQGSLRALSSAHDRRAQQLIGGPSSHQLSVAFALWTPAAIRALLRRPYERDDAAVNDGCSIEYPKIKAYATRANAEIGWGNDTDVRSDESRHRGHAPRNPTAIIEILARRRSLSVIAVATHQSKARFMIYRGGLSAERLIVFMQRLTKDARRTVLLILDNRSVHKAKAPREWLAAHTKQIAAFHLPPYSPEPNPTEYFNGDLKGEIQRVCPPASSAAISGMPRRLIAITRGQ